MSQHENAMLIAYTVMMSALVIAMFAWWWWTCEPMVAVQVRADQVSYASVFVGEWLQEETIGLATWLHTIGIPSRIAEMIEDLELSPKFFLDDMGILNCITHSRVVGMRRMHDRFETGIEQKKTFLGYQGVARYEWVDGVLRGEFDTNFKDNGAFVLKRFVIEDKLYLRGEYGTLSFERRYRRKVIQGK